MVFVAGASMSSEGPASDESVPNGPIDYGTGKVIPVELFKFQFNRARRSM